MEETPILLSKQQVAHALNLCLRSVDSLIAEKKLPTVRIGRRVLVHRDALEKFARHDHEIPSKPRKKGKVM